MNTGATFSADRLHRYTLWRTWSTAPHLTLVLMNPSTADEISNDATVERGQRRAQAGILGEFGGVKVVNVFAWRELNSSKLPRLIAAGTDIIGPENDQAIMDACLGAGMVICGWGKLGHNLLGRGPLVKLMLHRLGVKMHTFKVNADGSPKHPLYVGYDVMPVPYE